MEDRWHDRHDRLTGLWPPVGEEAGRLRRIQAAAVLRTATLAGHPARLVSHGGCLPPRTLAACQDGSMSVLLLCKHINTNATHALTLCYRLRNLSAAPAPFHCNDDSTDSA